MRELKAVVLCERLSLKPTFIHTINARERHCLLLSGVLGDLHLDGISVRRVRVKGDVHLIVICKQVHRGQTDFLQCLATG